MILRRSCAINWGLLSLLTSVQISFATAVSAEPQRRTGLVSVRVSNAVDELPIPHADVRLYIFGEGNFAYQAFADGGGRASFVVSSGSYRIVAEGERYETGSESVDIGPGQQIDVLIRLRRREKANPTGPGQVVSRAGLAVPEKAKKEFAQGMEAISKNPRASIGHFQRALDVYPSYAQAYCGVALALLSLKDREGAAQALEKAIRVDPSYSQAYSLRGRMYLEDRDCTHGVPLLEQSLRLNPQAWDARYYLGRCNYDQGRMEEALEQAKMAQQLPHATAIVRLLLADIYIAKQMKTEAIAELEAFEAEDPKNPRVSEARSRIGQLRTQP